ncbi:unnamed protein product [Boreogadus saida]
MVVVVWMRPREMGLGLIKVDMKTTEEKVARLWQNQNFKDSETYSKVAEMHGELIEFNERLYRSLMAKDHLIIHMRQELIDLRGPVPGDLSQTSDDPSLSDFETSHRALINVWIPSVFLQGRSANAYHVYQVYIRIHDNEWNVYRRYTEFRELHNHLRNKFPQVDTFSFPPKKALGNKQLGRPAQPVGNLFSRGALRATPNSMAQHSENNIKCLVHNSVACSVLGSALLAPRVYTAHSLIHIHPNIPLILYP